MRFEREQYISGLVETGFASPPGALNRHRSMPTSRVTSQFICGKHLTHVPTAPWTRYYFPALRSSNIEFFDLLGALESLAMLLVSTINRPLTDVIG
jgi:hypothetical protein